MWTLIAFVTLCVTSSNSQSEYFWQLSDVHYDPTYWTNQESCNIPIALEDLGGYGNPECDSPWNLTKEAILGMAFEGRLPKFIIWSGDTPANTVNDTLNQEKVLENIRNVTDLLDDIFPNIPVFPVLGNHDYYPKDQLPAGQSSMYEELGELWKNWIDFGGNYSEALESFKKGGYYTRIMHEVSPSVRGIVLNTNLYSPSNKQTEGMDDPADQFLWLESVLAPTAAQNEKVHLMIHIAPGFSGRDPEWRSMRPEKSERLNAILRKYGSNIIATYAAHEHYDSFHIYYDDDDHPVTTMFTAPSLTPRKDRYDGATPRNPAVRKYFYDRSNLQRLTDYQQFYLDLAKVNENEDDPRWSQLYTFNQAYGSLHLEPDQVNAAKETLKDFASDNFHNYYDYSSVGWQDPYIPCGCWCKENHICAIENVDQDDMDSCLKAAPCKASTLSSLTALTLLSCVIRLIVV